MQVFFLLFGLATAQIGVCFGDDLFTGQMKPPVKILQGNWLGAEVDTKIAELLLTEKLGIPVQIVPVQSNGQAGVFPLLHDGSAHAMLECWPSEHVLDKVNPNYVNVSWAYNLGVIGQQGWYIPTALTNRVPPTVEGLRTYGPTYLTSQTPDSHGKGALLNGGTQGEAAWLTAAAGMIGGPPGQGLGLGLSLEVVYGNDATEAAHIVAMHAAVDSASQDTAAIPRLFYFYEPNAAFATLDITRVALPPYDASCWTQTKIDNNDICSGYPVDVTFKAIWKGLQQANHPAWKFLKQMHITNADQNQIMAAALESDVTTAVCDWLQSHESKWEGWLH